MIRYVLPLAAASALAMPAAAEVQVIEYPSTAVSWTVMNAPRLLTPEVRALGGQVGFLVPLHQGTGVLDIGNALHFLLINSVEVFTAHAVKLKTDVCEYLLQIILCQQSIYRVVFILVTHLSCKKMQATSPSIESSLPFLLFFFLLFPQIFKDFLFKHLFLFLL